MIKTNLYPHEWQFQLHQLGPQKITLLPLFAKRYTDTSNWGDHCALTTLMLGWRWLILEWHQRFANLHILLHSPVAIFGAFALSGTLAELSVSCLCVILSVHIFWTHWWWLVLIRTKLFGEFIIFLPHFFREWAVDMLFLWSHLLFHKNPWLTDAMIRAYLLQICPFCVSYLWKHFCFCF